MMICCCSN